jgi:anti-anti-sigma factor
MLSSLEIKREINNSTLLLKITGLMDYSTIEGFEPNIPEKITNIIVDFSELDFIDSSGIGAVLSILYESKEHGASVKFMGLNETVTQLFDTVGVFQIMKALHWEGK